VCAQSRKAPVASQPPGSSSSEHIALGVPAIETHTALQTDAFKELVNKFAWVLGSTYRVPYANTRTAARQYAISIATRVVQVHGYPSKIAK